MGHFESGKWVTDPFNGFTEATEKFCGNMAGLYQKLDEGLTKVFNDPTDKFRNGRALSRKEILEELFIAFPSHPESS